MITFDGNIGGQYVSPVGDCSHLDLINCENNLSDLIECSEYDHEQLTKLTDNIIGQSSGICCFDLYIMKNFMNKNFKRMPKITEIGCGTSTRFFLNIGSTVETFALEDVHARVMSKKNLNFQRVPFNKLDVLQNEEIIRQSASKSELMFIDGDHSYNFIKFVFEEIILKLEQKIPIIIHDFMDLDMEMTYGEQCYIINFLKNSNHFNLFAFSAMIKKSKKSQNKLGDKFTTYIKNQLRHYYDKSKGPPPSICILN